MKKQFEYPTLLLVEHGETEFADPERIHGTKYDLPLTLEGHKQAADIAEMLKDYDIASLRTSPMQRAKETADHISDATGQEAEEDEGLAPLDSGYMSGMTHDAAQRRLEYYVANPHKDIPGGTGSYGDWWDTAAERMAKRLKETKSLDGQANVDVLHSSEIASMPAIIRGEGPGIWDKTQIPKSGKVSAVELHGSRWQFKPNWEG